MVRAQAVYVSLPSLSSSVFSCSDSRLRWHLLQHASPNLCNSTGFYFGCKISLAQTFYKAGGVISGCAQMSEHICWSKNVQTECVTGS